MFWILIERWERDQRLENGKIIRKPNSGVKYYCFVVVFG